MNYTGNVKTDTIIRTIILVAALINQVLAITGKERLPFYEEDIVQIISLIVTIGSTAWAWWKNNSFTSEAIQADETLKELKTYESEGK